jgi:hypothetical protein
MAKLEQFICRDFRQGRYTPESVSDFLAPENSVAHAININFDEIVGNAKVRAGTTKLGATVASGKACLGLSQFVGKSGTPNLLLAVYKGASTATIYYYNGTWNTSGTTTLSNTAKNRFENLGGRVFQTNSVNGMLSSADGNTWATTDCIGASDAKPSLIKRFSGRLLAAGDPTYPDRIYFSSIIDPSANPFITWNADAATGDWMDINPDDGGYLTGFSESSTFLLVFKNTGMYRLDAVSKTVDAQNIFNVGAVNQESIVLCQGVTYYFSGVDIRRTNGGYPEQISRAGVQDIINAIPQASWANVAGATDGLNVYWSVGNVTLRTGQDNQETITNCWIKYSPRDQSWSVHSYADSFSFLAQYTDTNGQLVRGASDDGDVHTINLGTTDNTTPISYLLEGQDLEFGSRALWKTISDKIIVYMKSGGKGKIQFIINGNDEKSVDMVLDKRVNIGKDINISGNFMSFKWFGESEYTSPILEGYEIQEITSQGINNG